MTSTKPSNQPASDSGRKTLSLDGCLSTFPPDRRRNSTKRCEPGRMTVPISKPSWAAFLSFCESERIKPPHAFLHLLQVLLHRYTLADVIHVGISTNRTIAVRVDLGGSPSLRESLLRSINATNHALLQPCSPMGACPPKEPQFRVLLCIPEGTSVSGLDLDLDKARQYCDLIITLCVGAEDVTLAAEYDTQLYNVQAIEQILAQLVFLLESLHRSLEVPITSVPLWRAEEAASHLRLIRQQAKHFSVRCMHERFEECVRKAPDAIALVIPGDNRREVTYAELNTSANRLAHYLRGRGVGAGQLIGIFLDRTPDLVVAILGVLKAGAAYLPIDLCYPRERVELMLKDTESPLIITHSNFVKSLPAASAEVLCVDQPEWGDLCTANPSSGVNSDSVIYCIFTSGSTGKPKGTLITHANVCRLFEATHAWFRFDDHDTWTLFHSCAFDFSVWELWGALIYGGRLVVVPFSDSRSPGHFHELLSAEHVTVLNQTPSAFGQLARVDEMKLGAKLNDLRLVIFGGEALNLQGLRGWFSKYGDAKPQLVNMYGITETTVHVTYRPLKMSDLDDAPGSVIGLPIPDLQLYLLDDAFQPVPSRVPGEIFVAGAGVSKGYLNRERLTTERFLSNAFPAQPEGKLYRTGDLARQLPGGDLEYLGRADQQVKIRGFRIELGEIESVLRKHPAVRDVLVIANDDGYGEKFLAAYVVPSCAEAPAVDTLRRAVQSKLPDYMVPSAFAFLSELPLTPHGKIDRAALPAAQIRRSSQPFLAPRSDLERIVAAVYQEVLHIDDLGIDDNFFDIGGTSLRLAQAHARLQELMFREFPITDLFAHPTVRSVADHFVDNGRGAGHDADVLTRGQRQRLALSVGRTRKR